MRKIRLDLKEYLQKTQKLIDRYLKKYLDALPLDSSKIAKAMEYSTFAGGKRFRPILCLATCETLGKPFQKAIPAVCALEFIHTFTLIHDDLPAMDNSDLRRGRSTCHKAFGEDIAILAGDAMCIFAFEIISKYLKPKSIIPKVIAELSKSLGVFGVVGGQELDILAEKEKASYKKVKEIHFKKTAALIVASIRIGAIISDATPSQMKNLTDYATNLGFAFQAVDDILDVTSNERVLGKPVGQDQDQKKSSLPQVLGLEEAKRLGQSYIVKAKKSLAKLGRDTMILSKIADFVLTRKK
jgi:geranylgeranyl diphosphate synthase type II